MGDLDLLKQSCKPLKGPENRLAEDDLEGYLPAIPGWRVVDGELHKQFRFDNYYETIAFVNALAFVAHRCDHHPDLEVHYNRVLVRYSTHDVGGVSMNDLICAAKADALIGV